METTKEYLQKGTVTEVNGKKAILTGEHYEDAELGLMIKSDVYPGGYPSDKHQLINYPGENPPGISVGISADTPVIIEAEPAVTFELAIIDEKAPVKITAQLITDKLKPLTDLTIANMFDEKGYEAVKKALSSKAVKTRTAIEKEHKEVIKTIKTRHAAELKEVNDYAEGLYVPCRAVEKVLQDKLSVIDTAKKVAADKLEAEEKERTEGRENKMFALGMLFNGQAFTGYGRTYTKNQLHGFPDDFYNSLVTELEVLQFDAEVTGKEPEAPAPVKESTLGATYNPSSSFNNRPNGSPAWGAPKQPEPKAEYSTAIYDKTLPDGTRIVLTKGEIQSIELGAVVTNDRVAASGIYVQVIK